MDQRGIVVSDRQQHGWIYQWQFRVGACFWHFAGDIAEVVVFNRGLTADERTMINEYLNGKYGLVPAIPATPADLEATAISPAQISLTWNDNLDQGASRVSIERKTGSDGVYTVVGEAVNATCYVDTNLTAGTTYFYRVRVINLAAWSNYSNEAQAITPETGSDIPLNNLLLWLKADAGLPQGSTNTPVNLWVDQSGKQQCNGGKSAVLVPEALGGRPVVRFGAQNRYFTLPNFTSGLTQAEAFVVLRTTDEPGSVGALWSMELLSIPCIQIGMEASWKVLEPLASTVQAFRHNQSLNIS